MNKLPISVLLVSYNEGFLLKDCLDSIQFCDEILFVDLESGDNGRSIAETANCRISSHAKVEMVEELFQTYLPMLKNDWVMLIDPDERIDPELKKDIYDFFGNIPADCGRINVPIVYYYKEKALKGTVWGGDKSGRLLLKRSAVEIGNTVHTSIVLKPGFLTYRIKRKGSNVDHHYWVQSYEQMLEKHKRYIQREGKAKYEKGERFTPVKRFAETYRAFVQSYITCKGFKDGFLGLFLSGFYAWYIYSSWSSLKKYQKQIQSGIS